MNNSKVYVSSSMSKSSTYKENKNEIRTEIEKNAKVETKPGISKDSNTNMSNVKKNVTTTLYSTKNIIEDNKKDTFNANLDIKEKVNKDNNIETNKNINKEIKAENETENKPETKLKDKGDLNLNSDVLTSTKTETKTDNILSEKTENKYDFLNFGSSFNTTSILNNYSSTLTTPSLLNNNDNKTTENALNTQNPTTDTNAATEAEKPKEESIFDKYPFLNNTGLSDITKAYLSSYSSGPRPELSDYTKAYLNSVSSSTSTSRPELSNLTKAYLSGNPGFGESENKD